jgi:hypothetical protein
MSGASSYHIVICFIRWCATHQSSIRCFWHDLFPWINGQALIGETATGSLTIEHRIKSRDTLENGHRPFENGSQVRIELCIDTARHHMENGWQLLPGFYEMS